MLHANENDFNAFRESDPNPKLAASSVGIAMKAHFREKYPIMLDGALADRPVQGQLLRQARESLAAGRVDPDRLPGPILRETLEQLVTPSVAATTQAGLIPVGPGSARVWWDEAVLDNLQDILAHLDKPRAVLRFYDITGLSPDAGRWHEIFDVDIDPAELGRTVPLWSNDRAYVVDLGYVYADGRFLRLARTNAVCIPRDKAGQAEGAEEATVESVLRRHEIRDRNLIPDQAAADWAAGRADFPERDMEAEMVVHMLYRAFLREGPRALRRSPRILRRDAATLHKEFVVRRRRRVLPADSAASPILLVRLDADAIAAPARLRYQPAMTAAPLAIMDAARFVWFEALLAAARSGAIVPMRPRRALVKPAAAEPALVRRMETAEPVSLALPANPVFEAARNLRHDLEAMEPVGEAELELVANVPDAFLTDSHERFGGRDGALSVFGGVEAKRMAKAGVRITRMALTLEGRMRPGARLKVAGRLVHADAQGRFRLECVLTGKRASIPMRAGTSIEGETRSLINVDWERRATIEKRKVYL